jgi:hypothetical protein
MAATDVEGIQPTSPPIPPNCHWGQAALRNKFIQGNWRLRINPNRLFCPFIVFHAMPRRVKNESPQPRQTLAMESRSGVRAAVLNQKV